eukprot:4207605-Amphidinium_carterae.1
MGVLDSIGFQRLALRHETRCKMTHTQLAQLANELDKESDLDIAKEMPTILNSCWKLGMILASLEDDNYVYMLLEHCPGGSLWELCSQLPSRR